MLYYAFINDYPYQDVDSVLILTDTEVICSYRFSHESRDLGNFLNDAERRGFRHMHRYDAYEVTQKQDALKKYQESKKLIEHLLEASKKDELNLAYRAARNNYLNAVRALDKAPHFAIEHLRDEVVSSLSQKKKEAESIFKIVRRVYEQEHMLDECLPREFDGLPGETIDLIYQQEILGD